MAWCCQTTSRYLDRCCPRSPTPYGVNRPQCVNWYFHLHILCGRRYVRSFFKLQRNVFRHVNFQKRIWVITTCELNTTESRPWFNIKMSSYQYRKSHCGDKTVVRSSYLHNGIPYTGKMTSLYWIRAQSPLDLPDVATTSCKAYFLWPIGRQSSSTVSTKYF